jgi:hypothetical protein
MFARPILLKSYPGVPNLQLHTYVHMYVHTYVHCQRCSGLKHLFKVEETSFVVKLNRATRHNGNSPPDNSPPFKN